MELLCAALGLLAFLLAVTTFVLFAQSRRRAHALEGARARIETAERGLTEAATRASYLVPLEGKLDAARQTVEQLRADLAARDSRLESEREAREQFRLDVEERFRHLASAALKGNEQSFLTLATQVFDKHKLVEAETAERRQQALDQLVEPIARTLAETRQKLEQIEKERENAFGQIKSQMISVGQEAARLTHALKSNPGARGRWGEESLRNALELAGLSPHCDFETQKTFRREDDSLRPDCIIRLPGGRHIVIDAKTSLNAYLDGCDTADEVKRETCLKRHADDLRRHMLSLSRKDYWDAVTSDLAARPDFVAMYVPGENFFSAAVERNSGLINEGLQNGVFIVTPTTLIALAKAIALGWRQEAIAENARHVAELGRELHKRLAVMGDHVLRMGKSLEDSVKAYNGFIGSLEGSVMPQARRFRDLQVVDGSKELRVIEPARIEVRQPVSGRDLQFGTEANVLGTG